MRQVLPTAHPRGSSYQSTEIFLKNERAHFMYYGDTKAMLLSKTQHYISIFKILGYAFPASLLMGLFLIKKKREIVIKDKNKNAICLFYF